MEMEEVNVKGEKVFLKKGKAGYRVIYPYKVDGKINWKNFLIGGSYWNILKILAVVGMLIFLMWSYGHDIEAVRQVCYTPLNIDLPSIPLNLGRSL